MRKLVKIPQRSDKSGGKRLSILRSPGGSFLFLSLSLPFFLSVPFLSHFVLYAPSFYHLHFFIPSFRPSFFLCFLSLVLSFVPSINFFLLSLLRSFRVSLMPLRFPRCLLSCFWSCSVTHYSIVSDLGKIKWKKKATILSPKRVGGVVTVWGRGGGDGVAPVTSGKHTRAILPPCKTRFAS